MCTVGADGLQGGRFGHQRLGMRVAGWSQAQSPEVARAAADARRIGREMRASGLWQPGPPSPHKRARELRLTLSGGPWNQSPPYLRRSPARRHACPRRVCDPVHKLKQTVGPILVKEEGSRPKKEDAMTIHPKSASSKKIIFAILAT